MKNRITPLLVIIIIAMIFQNSFSQDVNSNNYKSSKLNFWEQYSSYINKLQQGKSAVKPTDPSGLFYIDEKNNFRSSNDIIMDQPIKRELNRGIDAVTGYVFTQSSGTFTTINGVTGEVVLGTGNMDDNTYGSLPIGFTFNYSGTNYTTFGAASNGSMLMGSGSVPCCQYSGPLGDVTDNQISPFGYDLYSNVSGRHSYVVTGTAPNRVLTVEWGNFGFYYGPDGLLNFQIKLYESTNIIQFVYGGTITAPSSSRLC